MSKVAALVLAFAVDGLGAAGAVLVAVPFLRDFPLKRLAHRLRAAAPLRGLERATAAARERAQRRAQAFRQGDRAYVIWGLLLIALSYLLHTAGEIAAFASGE